MRNILLSILVVVCALSGFACSGSNANKTSSQGKTCPEISDTPTEAYTRLYAAVKSKNTDAIKSEMSKNTQDFAVGISQRQNSTVEKVFENGFTATTFAESLPPIRDERISGCWGAVEVRNSRDQIWEDLPFANEDGKWKLAVGESFAGSYKSPGKSQGAKEREAANALAVNTQPPVNAMNNSNTSTMSNVKTTPAPKYNGPQVEALPNKK